MKHLLFTFSISIIFSLCAFKCPSQVLSIGPGQMFYNSKTIIPVINQYESSNNKAYYTLNFALPELNKYAVGLELSTYRGWVDFNAYGETFTGFGSSRTTLFRFSPYLGYNLQLSPKLNFTPYIKIVVEQSFITGLSKGFSPVGDIEEVNGYVGTVYVEPIRRLQVGPGLGFNLQWNVIGRIYLRGDAYYAYGYRPFQKYYFDYTYQGIEHPIAEWHANGTGIFSSIGVGYRLWNVK